MLKIIVVTAMVVYSGISKVEAANLPREFIGVWTGASAGVSQCKMSDGDNNNDSLDDELISVSPSGIQSWTTTCKVVNVREVEEGTAEVDLSCGSKGETWRSKQILHVQNVGSRRQLVSVLLQTFDHRNYERKAIKNQSASNIHVSINLECK